MSDSQTAEIIDVHIDRLEHEESFPLKKKTLDE